jgi:hypothetical protein
MIQRSESSCQELGQSDISVLRKAELKDRLGNIRKVFDKQMKEKETLANKAVCPTIVHHNDTHVVQQGTRTIPSILQGKRKC